MTKTKLLLAGIVSVSIVTASVYALNIYKNKNNNLLYYTNNLLLTKSKLLSCNDNHDFLELKLIDDKSIIINGVLSNIESMKDVDPNVVKPSVCGVSNFSHVKLVETGQYYFYMSKQSGYLYITDIVNKATNDSLDGAWKIKLS